MIKSGLKKIKKDHKDYDYLKSHHFGIAVTPSFPSDFNVDAGLTMPNQEEPNDIFHIPQLPFGCTGYTTTEMCQDEDSNLYNPRYTYDDTPPHDETEGRDIRDALESARRGLMDVNGQVGYKRTAYFNIRSSGMIDFFDAIRLAIYSAQPEKRSVSIGVPWFPEFSSPVNGVLPIPKSFNTANASWHNAKVAGWKSINGISFLMVKSWQGKEYGDQGWCYMSRELCNSLLNIHGTGAFTISKTAPDQILTVDLSVIQTIVSFIRRLFGF